MIATVNCKKIIPKLCYSQGSALNERISNHIRFTPYPLIILTDQMTARPDICYHCFHGKRKSDNNFTYLIIHADINMINGA